MFLLGFFPFYFIFSISSLCYTLKTKKKQKLFAVPLFVFLCFFWLKKTPPLCFSFTIYIKQTFFTAFLCSSLRTYLCFISTIFLVCFSLFDDSVRYRRMFELNWIFKSRFLMKIFIFFLKFLFFKLTLA